LTFQSLRRPLRKAVTSFIADLWFWGARLWPYADAAHPKLLTFWLFMSPLPFNFLRPRPVLP